MLQSLRGSLIKDSFNLDVPQDEASSPPPYVRSPAPNPHFSPSIVVERPIESARGKLMHIAQAYLTTVYPVFPACGLQLSPAVGQSRLLELLECSREGRVEHQFVAQCAMAFGARVAGETAMADYFYERATELGRSVYDVPSFQSGTGFLILAAYCFAAGERARASTLNAIAFSILENFCLDSRYSMSTEENQAWRMVSVYRGLTMKRKEDRVRVLEELSRSSIQRGTPDVIAILSALDAKLQIALSTGGRGTRSGMAMSASLEQSSPFRSLLETLAMAEELSHSEEFDKRWPWMGLALRVSIASKRTAIYDCLKDRSNALHWARLCADLMSNPLFGEVPFLLITFLRVVGRVLTDNNETDHLRSYALGIKVLSVRLPVAASVFDPNVAGPPALDLDLLADTPPMTPPFLVQLHHALQDEPEEPQLPEQESISFLEVLDPI